jgi:hypothetical protein
MGFAGDLGAEFTGYLMNFIMQIASSVTSAFMRMFGRKPKTLCRRPNKLRLWREIRQSTNY